MAREGGEGGGGGRGTLPDVVTAHSYIRLLLLRLLLLFPLLPRQLPLPYRQGRGHHLPGARCRCVGKTAPSSLHVLSPLTATLPALAWALSVTTGESKLTMKQNVQYLQQLAALYYDKFGVLLVVFLLALVMVGLLVLRLLAQAVLS